jgi:hypothetical protein
MQRPREKKVSGQASMTRPLHSSASSLFHGDGADPVEKPGVQCAFEARDLSPDARRATGPRSLAGKDRTKHNALKHGIFSKAVLLKGESRQEFVVLLTGLRADFRPVGTLEETLVEKLAVLIWRYRRLIAFETGGIRKNLEFPGLDETNDSREEGANEVRVEIIHIGQPTEWDPRGLICDITDPTISRQCVELLNELRANIETAGFNPDKDREILRRIYGTDKHLRTTVRDEYEIWSNEAACSEKEPLKNEHASPEQCAAKVLDAIANEIRRLVSEDRARREIASERAEISRPRASVPRLPDLDRLLRYETNIERAFDRTLGQLERVQRLRLGQPVLPAIKLDVSSS